MHLSFHALCSKLNTAFWIKSLLLGIALLSTDAKGLGKLLLVNVFVRVLMVTFVWFVTIRICIYFGRVALACSSLTGH